MVTRLTQAFEHTTSQNKIVFNLGLLYYTKLVEQEIALAEISEKDCVLCIGGGPCPYTALLINKITGASVTAIDCCNNCAHCAKRLVKEHFDNRINIICAEGSSVDYTDYSVIHIAMQIRQREDLAKAISRNAKNGTRIITRSPKDRLDFLYSSQCASRHGIQCLKKTRACARSNVENLFLYTVGKHT